MGALASASIQAFAAPTPHYAVINRFPISGNEGWDYLSVDSANHHLFISRSGRVAVMNTMTGKMVGEISKLQGVHGIAIAGKLGKGFISNGRGNSVTVFDLKSFATEKTIAVGQNPDAILFDSKTDRVLTMNGGSNDITVINPMLGKVIGTIKVSGRPEFAMADGTGNIYLNIEDKSLVEKIDILGMKSLGTMPLAPGEEPSGMAIDNRRHLVFSVCGNKMMTILNVQTKKLAATAPIGDGPDAAGYDPKLELAFSSNGETGTMTVVGQVSGKWKAIQEVKTQKSARTMILDPKTHLIYLIAADYVPAAPGERWGHPKPGSTVIIVVGPKA